MTTTPLRVGQRVVLNGAIVTVTHIEPPLVRVRFDGDPDIVTAYTYEPRSLSHALHHARSVLSSVAAEIDPEGPHFVGLAAEVLALADAAEAAEKVTS